MHGSTQVMAQTFQYRGPQSNKARQLAFPPLPSNEDLETPPGR